ncbi:MAG: hypothetical protein BHW37_05200 [Firmicutes bacterium CAG:272_52_7]|nr:MAG: hypothetical protein BHW37_05200 [Firmicutes bacterium CAG:272_52_7]
MTLTYIIHGFKGGVKGEGKFFDFLNQKRTQNRAHNKTVPAPDSTGLSGAGDKRSKRRFYVFLRVFCVIEPY